MPNMVETLQGMRRKAEKALQEYQRKLIAGEVTTGDPIHDFVVVTCDDDDLETIKRYRKVNDLLRGNAGQLGLLELKPWLANMRLNMTPFSL